TLEQAMAVQTFPIAEVKLQTAVEQKLCVRADPAMVALARGHQSSFWSSLRSEVQARWALIATAGEVLVEADRVEAALKAPSLDAAALLQGYVGGEQPWCRLDTVHRHLEWWMQAFDFDIGDAHRHLQALAVRARQRHAEVAARLAEQFTRAY